MLPLNELHGELRGLAATNVLKQQLQTGQIGMPSITTTLKDSGVVNFTLEEEGDQTLAGDGSRGRESTHDPPSKEDGESSTNFSSESQIEITVVSIHAAKKSKSYDTKL